MRIVIIGAGAMGGLFGGRLSLAGHDVALVDSRPDVLQAIDRNGLRLSGVGGEHVITIPCGPDAAAFAPADVVLVLTDTNATAAAADQAGRALGPQGFAVTLQNGIGNTETLVERLGAERVAAGSTYHSAAAPGPGQSLHTNDGKTSIGELDGGRTPRIEALAAVLAETGFRVEVSDDIIAVIWTKFAVNCAINPIAAVTGLRAGEIGGDPHADALQDHVLRELLEVVTAKGLRLNFSDPHREIRRLSRLTFNKPSMLQHMEQGRPTEIDALNGALVREAGRLGIAVPYNDALVLMVKARNGKVIRELNKPDPDWADIERRAVAEERARRKQGG